MAEFPGLGAHCEFAECQRLDFLPVKCDARAGTFCSNHLTYISHQCASAQQKDVQVPVCPLCNRPVPVRRGELPDRGVGEHIDRDCASDPAVEQRRRQSRPVCSLSRCKKRELVPVTCPECRLNFCLKHRHAQDHDCKGFQGDDRAISNAGAAAVNRQHNERTSSATSNKHGSSTSAGATIADDEAFARALQASLNERSGAGGGRVMTQEELDAQLAQQLQEAELQEGQPGRGTTQIHASGNRAGNTNRDRCNAM